MLLNFDLPATQTPKKKTFSIAILLLASFGLIGQTLASNINLGSGAPLEFGQGIQSLVSCAPSSPISLTPQQSFENAPGAAATYKLTGISLQGIQNSCVGSDFIIRAYGLTNEPLALFDGNKTQLRVYQSESALFSKSVTDGFTILSQNFGSFLLAFNTPVSQSKDIYRFTVETVAHDKAMIRYNVGDTGPSGGLVFLTPNSPSNSSPLYFEATRNYIGTAMWCNQWPIDIQQAVGVAIGAGRANTDAINSICTSGAANLASAHFGGNYSDWFLPSQGELEAYFNSGISSLIAADYWTSTQYDGDDAITVSSASASAGGYFKIGTLPVVAVRSFS